MLADPSKFANQLVSKKLSERKMVLGSMLLNFPLSDVTIVNNVVTFTFYRPPGTHPTRVWMKFPLEPEDVAAEQEKYRAFDEFELPAQIPKENPSQAGETVRLAPKPTPARWYEVPLPRTVSASSDSSSSTSLKTGRPGRTRASINSSSGSSTTARGERQAYQLEDPVTKVKSTVKAQEVANWPVKIREAGPGGEAVSGFPAEEAETSDED